MTRLVQNICEEEVETWESEYSMELWMQQVDGNLWDLNGDVGHYEPMQALQITGWEAAGYVLPDDVSFFWGDGVPEARYWRIRSSRLCRDHLTVQHIQNVAYSACQTMYLDSWVTDEKPGWRPLFAFRGPCANPAVDDHTVFFRRTAGRFEYKYIVSRTA